MPTDLLADIALRASIPGVEPVFTYRVPAPLRGIVRLGQLVWAPLRRQRVQGVVVDLYGPEGLRASQSSLRDLLDVADPEAALTPAQIRLARWLSDYYRAPLYEALALMLPPGVSQQSEPTWRATAAGQTADLGALPEGERAVLYLLRQRGEQPERTLRQSLRGSDADLRAIYIALQERGLAVRGAATSRPRARPRIERLIRLRADPADLATAQADLERAPKQLAVLRFLSAHTPEAEHAIHEGHEKENGELNTQHSKLKTPQPPALSPQPLSPRAYPLLALYKATGASNATVQALERRGLVELSTREVRRDPLAGDDVPPDIPPPLSSAQERAWREIAAALEEARGLRLEAGDASADKNRVDHEASGLGLEADEASANNSSTSSATAQASGPKPQAAFLLHGVTGSGKTEVYLRAIGRALRLGRQALVLVPEIALTAQLVRRFAARFPGTLAVLHSGLSLGERYDEWRRLRSGEARLAIGSRSAVFAPLPELGLIIVDEEHETSYKHDGSPRYHARDTARRLAELTGSVLILGSATPALETFAAARAGRLRLLSMPERVGMSFDANGLPRPRSLPLPPVRIIDMRRELQQGNRSIFSRQLQDALRRTLERNEQAVLFLNRRGAASFIMCRDCGHVINCPNCTTPLAVHYDEDAPPSDPHPAARDQPSAGRQSHPAVVGGRASLMVCHSCNYRALVPLHCPACWSRRIKSFGVGTQRVAEEVGLLFPEARVMRWDRDSVTRKGDHSRMLDRFLNREADVLVGTQMIAKGLDLPLVSVVGVITADTALNLPDFRAGERTFQLLTQVAGRAGRRGDQALVIIQTYTPDHYALLAAQEHDYAAFYSQEIAFRRQTHYPPFGKLVRFIYSGPSDSRCQREAERLATELRSLAEHLELPGWGLVGPAPAFFHRQRNRFRWHLVLRAPDPGPLLAALRVPPGWVLDVDPVHVL
ncbi:MAG TPA: primosomal protein N' [Roseiflexaceae bacterium]|nr:primosomal protein N' [Roseiflexaceae bacterium]